MLVLFAASLAVLRLYQTDLIQAAVVNAMVQKAPPGEEERIRRTFAECRSQARRDDRQEEYLRALFAVSQRLEKTQKIDQEQLDELLKLLQEAH
ncbi:MAG TPA: hypothetical protein VLU25_03205 [Acidobacteriota bacterium]|nr:hypothetical protein [Acidobacteriota bacterium]